MDFVNQLVANPGMALVLGVALMYGAGQVVIHRERVEVGYADNYNALVQRMIADVAGQRKDIDELKLKLAAVTTDRDELQSKLRVAQGRITDLETENVKLKVEVERLRVEVAQFKAQVTELERGKA